MVYGYGLPYFVGRRTWCGRCRWAKGGDAKLQILLLPDCAIRKLIVFQTSAPCILQPPSSSTLSEVCSLTLLALQDGSFHFDPGVFCGCNRRPTKADMQCFQLFRCKTSRNTAFRDEYRTGVTATAPMVKSKYELHLCSHAAPAMFRQVPRPSN